MTSNRRSTVLIMAGLTAAFWFGWAGGYHIGRQERPPVSAFIKRPMYRSDKYPSLPDLKEKS
jgi:hypothetical protein